MKDSGSAASCRTWASAVLNKKLVHVLERKAWYSGPRRAASPVRCSALTLDILSRRCDFSVALIRRVRWISWKNTITGLSATTPSP